MKTPCVSLLLGVCVLLLAALTVSAVSLSVSPNLQQFFSGSSSVSLSCADGWTVRRTRGGLTEDCGAAAGFEKVNSSSCVLDLSVSSDGRYFCENPSGQQSDGVSFNVSDKGVILEIPALPVMTGSDVTLRCKPRDGSRPKSYFFRDGGELGSGPEGEWTLSNIQKSDEGLYTCSTDIHPPSPQSRLRVRDPPPPNTTTSPPLSTLSSSASCCNPSPSSSSPSFSSPDSSSSSSSSLLLYLLVLPVVLVLVGVVVLWRKHRGGRGADSASVGLGGGDGCEEPAEKSVCLCFSGLFLLTAAGVCVLLLSALTVSADGPPLLSSESVLRLFCHLVVFCLYCISTGLLRSICCSRKTPNKPPISKEMSQHGGGGQGLDEEYDDVTADVTTEHAF